MCGISPTLALSGVLGAITVSDRLVGPRKCNKQCYTFDGEDIGDVLMGSLYTCELLSKFEPRQNTLQKRDKDGEASRSLRTEPLEVSSIYCKLNVRYYSETTGD